MAQIDSLNDWAGNLGLLPVNLYLNQHNENQFILLDGFHGDFCLGLREEPLAPEEYKSSAWSSNARNFVSVGAENVKVYNWLKPGVESASRASVETNLDRFYSYLTSNSNPSSGDIVTFVLSIYRKLRNLTDDAEIGTSRALDLLFLLLAAHEDNIDPNRVDEDEWGITRVPIPANFDRYLEEFSRGFSDSIKPKTGLILRHASGLLFEETSKGVSSFDKSVSLLDHTFSSSYTATTPPYSSVHYTPAFLARCVVENSIKFSRWQEKDRLTIFDPACGSSEFLMEILKQLKTRGYAGNVKVIGWDSAEAGIHTSKFLLSYEKREWQDRLTFELQHVEDSLALEWPNDCDFILMNPPFQSWEQMGEGQRALTREILGTTFQKRPNQASVFLYKATQALRGDGIIGAVLPSSILSLDSYVKLRSFINERLSIRLIGKLGNFLFTAMTDVSIFIAHEKSPDSETTLLWTNNRKGVATEAIRALRRFQANQFPTITSQDFSVYSVGPTLGTFPDWKISSLSEFETREILENSVEQKQLTRIKFVFEVKQGIRTGNNSVFKVSLFDYERLPENERRLFRPVVDNKAISNGRLSVNGFVWYPYDANGRLIHNEDQLREEAPLFYRMRLKPNEAALRERALRGDTHWWELSWHRSWLLTSEPRLVSTEFGRSDSFAFDEYGEYVVERGYGWKFKKQQELNDPFYYYLAIFSSRFFDRLLSIYSRQLAGGNWYDLGSKFTKDIPIPRFPKTPQTIDIDLVAIGTRISAGDRVEDSELNRKVLERYGLIK